MNLENPASTRPARFRSAPDLFIRGKETYQANLNPDNLLGTIQSIEQSCVDMIVKSKTSNAKSGSSDSTVIRLDQNSL